MPTMQTTLDPEQFRDNWTRRSCFVWFHQPDDAEEFGLRILSHRDSGLIDQSNSAIIRKRLLPFVKSGDVIFFDCGHWAVGTTHEVAVRVYKSGTTETTAAFDELARIVEELDGYPILDESDYSSREYEAAMEGIRLSILGTDLYEQTLPEGWAYKVFGWLDDNEPNELENRDDQGAFPSSDTVRSALLDLGLIVTPVL